MSQIIACIDASKSAHSVCDATAWCSQRLSAPALALHVLDKDESLALSDLTGAIGLGAREHLLKELAELDHQRAKIAMEQGKIMLAAAEAQMRKQGCQEVASRQLHASLPEALLDMAPHTRVVVLGRQGQSHERAQDAVGSQLETILRLSEHPVWVTPSEFVPPTRVTIAYDASPTAQRMLTRLAASPLLNDLPIQLLMAASDTPDHQAQLKAAQAELAEGGKNAQIQLTDDEPLGALRSAASDPATLLCMGAFGHSRIREFLVGSTTNATLRHAHCSVLMVR